jgi:hypothetical protein
MRITRETLLRIARETAQKQALSDPGLVAAYLTGSLRTDTPFLGGTTDVDIVLVHQDTPAVRRESQAITPDFSLDITHTPRSEYDKPKELRLHPWLGPELYDPLPLYTGQQHFFEFVQASVRDKYNDPSNVAARAHRNAEHARQLWSELLTRQDDWPPIIRTYLKSVNHAANAIAILTGAPLAERRFLLQFPERAQAAGVPELADALPLLLGADNAETETLKACLAAWEKDFTEAASKPKVDARIAAPRLAYYKKAFEAMLESESPQAILWPLLFTWMLAAHALPPTRQATWESACKGLGVVGPGFEENMSRLDKFLDIVEERLEQAAE